MRMWKVNPKFMCRKHLIGEHVEMHMFDGCIEKGKSLQGYIKSGLVEVHNLKNRHDELAAEMIYRGYNHKSPIWYKKTIKEGKVNMTRSIIDLKNRCTECFTKGRIRCL